MLNSMISGGSSGRAKVDSTAENITLGTDAGKLLAPTDVKNIAIGFHCLETLSSEITFANIAIGYEAMALAENVDASVAIGYKALKEQAVGLYNVAIGYYSMLSADSSCNFNTAVGAEAFRGDYSSKPGSGDNYNTSIGYRSMYIAETGCRENTAVGGGVNNVAIGKSAGNDITSGGGNICIGHDADTATSGTNYGVAIGTGATASNNAVSIVPFAYTGHWSANYDNLLFAYGMKRYKVFEKEITMSDADDGAVACTWINSTIPNKTIVTYIAIEVVTLSDKTTFDVRFCTSSAGGTQPDGTIMPNQVELLGPNIPSCRSGNVPESGTSPAIQLGTSAGVVKQWYTSKPDVLLDDTTLGGTGWTGTPMFVQHGTANGDANPSTPAKVRVYMEFHGTT